MKNWTLYLFIIFTSNLSFGQVGINNPNPDSTAILDLTSNKLGLLVPRMTSFERRAIVDPANALLVYDMDDAMLFFYDSTHNSIQPSNWTGVTPFRFRDDLSDFDVTTSLYQRDIYTQASVRSLGIGTETPLSTISVIGNISVGNNSVTAPENGLAVEGQLTTNSSITVADTVRASVLEGFGTIPIGGIIMWSGNPNTLPNDWVLCDGIGAFTDISGFSRAVPDLRGRFVVGYDPASGTNNYVQNVENYGAVRNTGGQTVHTLTKAEMPAHNHSASASNDTHFHDLDIDTGGGGTGDATGLTAGYFNGDNANSNSTSSTAIDPDTHSHTITIQNEGNGNSHENRPEYYVIAYIIRVQ